MSKDVQILDSPKKADLVCAFHADQETCIHKVKNKVDYIYILLIINLILSGGKFLLPLLLAKTAAAF